MTGDEKAYNCNLFSQLDMLEDVLEVATEENAVETIAMIEKKIRQVERKLYQQPPLVKSNLQ